MDKLIVWVHVFTCFFIIVTVLLQSGKGAAIGSTFGGSSQTVFGTSGPTGMLTKFTTFFAIVFMCTSLYLTYYSVHKSGDSVMDGMATIETPVEAGADTVETVIPIGDITPAETPAKGEVTK